MDTQGTVFREAEIDANKYAARCLCVACIIVILGWVLNLVGFFVADELILNTSASIAIFALASPMILLKFFHLHGAWVKYYICICFVLGISILYIGMTYQMILAWSCPILLSCHFYSQRVARVTYITSLILLFITMFLGAVYGVWDCNMMDSTNIGGVASDRINYLLEQHYNGEDTLINIVKLYYVSRALVLTVVYAIGITLSKRTRGLLDRQQADLVEKERIDAELSVATEIQNAMLPNIFPAYPMREEFELYATMTPSKEVGGDFYDFFLVDDDHLALVIADVSGKGVPAAMFMMSAQIMIKNLTTQDKTPSQVLTEVNEQLCETNQNDMFVTVWFGIYEISTGKLIAANAGHEYPIVCRNNEKFQLFKDKHGFVIGGMEDMSYHDYEMQLEQGETLFVYTDGVLEAINEQSDAYGTERLLTQLDKTKNCSLEELLSGVKIDVDSFANTMLQFDDITMLAIRRNI